MNGDFSQFPLTVSMEGFPHYFNWLRESTAGKMKLEKPYNEEEVTTAVNARISKLLSSLFFANETFTSSPTKDRIKSWSHSLPLRSYLYLTLSNLYELVLINHDDVSEIKAKWRIFQVEFASLRNEAIPELSRKISQFIDWVIEELAKVDGNKSAIQEEVELLKTFSALIQREPFLLNISLGVTENEMLYFEEKPLIKLDITTALNINKTTLCLLRKDFTWIVELVAQEMEADFKDYPYPIPSEKTRRHCLEQLHKLKSQSQYKLNALNLGNLSTISQELLKLRDLSLEIKALTSSTGIGDVRNCIYFLETLFKLMKEELSGDPEKWSEKQKKKVNLYTLIQKSGFLRTEYELGEWSLSEMVDWTERTKKQMKWHALFNTFILSPFGILFGTSQAINVWATVHSRLGHLPRFIDELKRSTQNYTPFLGRYNSDVEKQLLRLDDVADHVHPRPVSLSKAAKRKQRTLKDESKKTDEKKEETDERKDDQSLTPTATLPLTPSLPAKDQRIQKLSDQLTFLLIQTPDHAAKISLRQARLYIDDLSLIQEMYAHSLPPGMRVFAGVTTIATHFFLTEQLLRHHVRDPSLTSHNLNVLSASTPLPLTHTIISDLYMANHWVAYPFEELVAWSEICREASRSPPKVLNSLKIILQDPSSSEAFSALNGLKSLTQGVIDLSQEIEAPLKTETPLSPSQNTRLSPPFPISLVGVKEAMQTCRTLLSGSSLEEDHPKNLALQQASYHFYLFAQSCLAFEKDPIHSYSLSFYLRKGIFSLNKAIEDVLFACFIGKYGYEYPEKTEHDLVQLYKRVNEKPEPSSLVFLETTWTKAQVISRYPFEYSQLISPLHELILQAELLKEHPELNLGFKMTEEATSLNFIPVSTNSDINVEVILKKWERVVSETMSFINHILLTTSN